MLTDDKHLVPDQAQGASTDTTSSHSFETLQEAQEFFNIARERLLDVNTWEKRAGIATADFMLCNEAGEEVNRQAQEGDHFKIDIPGPGSATGEGYDWVKVEKIVETTDGDAEAIVMTVRPATNPNNSKQDVAHFFSDTATSSFIIERKGNIVTAAVKGRNEKPNAAAESAIDKARNTAVAAAAITGFSKLQWKGLTDGLVKMDHH